MKALTIHQPHAMMLAIGLRTIETRSWFTRYRGPLLIHASKRWDDDIAEQCREAAGSIRDAQFNKLSRAAREMGVKTWGELLGCALAVAVVADCKPIPQPTGTLLDRQFGGFGPGRYGFVLTGLHTLPTPIPVRGAQGLWDPDETLIERVAIQTT